MKQWINRIGGGGLAALAAVALAGGTIAYRLLDNPAPTAEPSVQGDPIAELERKANADPSNAGGWQELGFAYFERGRFAEAAEAYRRATSADPKSAVLWSSLGEALVMASERDPMPPAAREAFRKAAEIEPADPRARYFLAVEKDLAGDHEGAIADWLALLRDTPEGAPWEDDLKRTIEQVGKIQSIDVAPRIAAATTGRPARLPDVMPAIPGPTPEQLAAAGSIPPSQQREMAEGMVSNLAARLEREPADVDGWIMLMRSYQTLGRAADARNALGRAVTANPGQKARLEQAAQGLGVS